VVSAELEKFILGRVMSRGGRSAIKCSTGSQTTPVPSQVGQSLSSPRSTEPVDVTIKL
jgi:hypothetical protein